jgi:hypothetical protein
MSDAKIKPVDKAETKSAGKAEVKPVSKEESATRSLGMESKSTSLAKPLTLCCQRW